MGKNEAFKHFGAVARNQQWSWSARSPDGKTVVITLWRHKVNWKARPIVFDTFDHPELSEWTTAMGNKERIENLKWALDHCDGEVRVVIVHAKDPAARPMQIEDCQPQRNLVMRVTKLNPDTGEFRVESVNH